MWLLIVLIVLIFGAKFFGKALPYLIIAILLVVLFEFLAAFWWLFMIIGIGIGVYFWNKKKNIKRKKKSEKDIAAEVSEKIINGDPIKETTEKPISKTKEKSKKEFEIEIEELKAKLLESKNENNLKSVYPIISTKIEKIKKPITKRHSSTNIRLNSFVDNYTLIDIETSGLNSSIDDIYEVAGIHVRNNKIIDNFASLIKPNNFIEVPSIITKITGITTEMILKEGLDPIEIMEKYFNFISEDTVIGHNVTFDIRFLNNKSKNGFMNNYIDTLPLAREVWPNERHNRLQDLRKRIGTPKNDDPHRAFSDSLMTKRVYETERKILEPVKETSNNIITN